MGLPCKVAEHEGSGLVLNRIEGTSMDEKDSGSNPWPEIHLSDWAATRDTLHMWTQIVGKVRLVQTDLVNHWWNVPLYVTARGLSTGVMPYRDRSFEVLFDFINHVLVIETSDGTEDRIPLQPMTVAAFYETFMECLKRLGLDVQIYPVPVEIPDPIPFREDTVHASYDREYANRFWRVLLQTDRIFKSFRSRFIGKSSSVHFFWGSFDLAVTRFSGRPAPEREGADMITKEAYSHEVISHGFWPGGGGVDDAAFYAYGAPEPDGLKTARVSPTEAGYHTGMNEFIMMYEDVRKASNPESLIMEFLQSTYEAAADLAHWDRPALER
jgi:hypothetical protein